MIYLTFLGTTDYEVKKYQFTGDSTVYESKFIQVAVVKRHLEEITKMIVVVTKESRIKHYESLIEELKEVISQEDIISVEIDSNICFEDFVEKVRDYFGGEESELIMDITHGFRTFSMIMTMVVQYYQVASGMNLLHHYYGNLQSGEVVDNIQSMKRNDLIHDLYVFDKTLLLPELIGSSRKSSENDELLGTFIHWANELNNNFEYSEYDKVVLTIVKLYNEISIRLNSKNKEHEFRLYRPFFEKIERKFNPLVQSINRQNTKDLEKNYNFSLYAKLVVLLLEHERIQTAITYLDLLIRDYFVAMYFPKYKLKSQMKNEFKVNNHDKNYYDITQEIKCKIFGHNYDKSNQYTDRAYVRDLQNTTLSEIKQKIGTGMIQETDFFYSNIRNSVHHGKTVMDKKDNKSQGSIEKTQIKKKIKDLALAIENGASMHNLK